MRYGELVHVVAVDPDTGADHVWPVIMHVSSITASGVEFRARGVDGSSALLYTTDEGRLWCRDDPEDVAVLNALCVMAE